MVHCKSLARERREALKRDTQGPEASAMSAGARKRKPHKATAAIKLETSVEGMILGLVKAMRHWMAKTSERWR